MKRIFVSYKTEDRARAGVIVQMLRDSGLDAWWDQDIRPGQGWRQTIEENLNGADLCLVLWSSVAVGREGQWVKEEAEYAKQAGKYLGVLIDKVAPPFGFSELQSIHASDWDAAGIARTREALLQTVASFHSESAGAARYSAPIRPVQYEPSRPERPWPRLLLMGCLGIPGTIGIGVALFALYMYLFPVKTETIDQTVSDQKAPITSVNIHALRTGTEGRRMVQLKAVYPKTAPPSDTGDVYICDLNRDGSVRMSTDIGRYPEEWESRNPVYTRKGEPFEVFFTVKPESIKTMRSLYLAFPAKKFDPCAIHTPDLLPLVGKFKG